MSGTLDLSFGSKEQQERGLILDGVVGLANNSVHWCHCPD